MHLFIGNSSRKVMASLEKGHPPQHTVSELSRDLVSMPSYLSVSTFCGKVLIFSKAQLLLLLLIYLHQSIFWRLFVAPYALFFITYFFHGNMDNGFCCLRWFPCLLLFSVDFVLILSYQVWFFFFFWKRIDDWVDRFLLIFSQEKHFYGNYGCLNLHLHLPIHASIL